MLAPAAKRRRAKHLVAAPPDTDAADRLLAELELLFFTPTRFGSLETYTLMNALRGKLRYCQDVRTRRLAEPDSFIEADLADNLVSAAAALRTAAEDLLPA
jgi:hypothetical protein